MADLFIACRRADKERADIIAKALAALHVVVSPDIEPKGRGVAKAVREAIAKARVALVLWPAAVLDPAENHAGLLGQARAAQEQGKLVAARLEPFATERLEAPFGLLPAPELGAWFADAATAEGKAAWTQLLDLIGAALGRPGLAALAAAMAADVGKVDEPAQRDFARKFPDDIASAAIWGRFEAAERERFAAEFRKAHGVLIERGQAAQDRLKATLDGFTGYLKAVRAGQTAVAPDPREAIADGATALRESVARLAADNERLQTAMEKSRTAQLTAATATGRLPLRWAGISAVAFLVGSVAAAGITEFAGPLRGDSHPRIAELSRLAHERAELAQASTAELPRLREALRTAARRAETAEANLRVARTQLAHSQTELIQRQNQAAEAGNQMRRAQAELQTAQQASQTAAQTAEQRIQEAINRANAAEIEARSLREAQVAAAQTAPAASRDVTGSVTPRGAAHEAAPAAGQPPTPPSETTGSIPQAPPPDGPYRHRRDRWSFAIGPDFRLESDNDLPGPVNSVLVHERNPDAVVVISANNAGQMGTCTPQAWYYEAIVEGPRQRRGQVVSDAGLPPHSSGFRGFTVSGRGVLHGERFRTDLDYYDIVAQSRNEPGVVYLIQARYPRAMAREMVRNVNELWRSFQISGPRAYPTRC
ncbi:MAG: toll/interleukin-1 receptor domain-containing protein [Phreatobacter sp.]|uniref:hypothetical protein n=1 Tax=Phreatobacter sp. TaxID=1966341 RepID=UPI001A54D0E8|nr:hypothetical protein [Phreatobacter sp.]MBL8568450.1 toll/interleukin-1 receptor domain-containing protein [Phreatobacter sp.]